MSTNELRLREIQPADNPAVAAVIRTVLTEFGANLPGTAFFDPAIDHLYDYYQQPRAAYFVLERDGKLVGGGGIGPLEGAGTDVCELQKLYLLPEGRGQGWGRELMDRCLAFARAAGYRQCYLESLPQLHKGVQLYERYGFQYLDQPLGQTGHNGCDLWMLLAL
ncbi:putative acetyltransferase [Catalinimonas alkaloidigena]|uniref:Putative acetyltransferase n=1 Tax=Catalinimonas alkaloidigena TaxID=1075417 RepID=A0A1G9LZ44_9BACT|nr:GNAT family N-acetyltransferase [Catalinimonas alkaloidigena]SDL67248.1 putative acetyltransferase [Catalinimonas alkaloidigena]